MAASKKTKKAGSSSKETPRVKALTYLFTLLSFTFAALALVMYG